MDKYIETFHLYLNLIGFRSYFLDTITKHVNKIYRICKEDYTMKNFDDIASEFDL